MDIAISKKITRTQSFYKHIVLSMLKKLEMGHICLIDATGTIHVSGQPSEHGMVSITIINADAYQKIVLGGDVGFAEGYINGEWQTDNLIGLINIILINKKIISDVDSFAAKIIKRLGHISRSIHRNTIKNAKKNILAHYDLSNDFFKLFLDQTMMYSCALFTSPEMTLEAASQNKIHTILTKLNLQPNDHLLEIGSGWGTLAITAAKKYGCRVTTTTISDAQYQFVKKRISDENLSEKIELLNIDYRDLSGQFDKIVSVEMIEAVGHHYFTTFFKQCNDLLKPGGLMFLQAITINDQIYDKYIRDNDFIKQYIFPGGALPSNYIINHATRYFTTLQLVYLQDIGKNYALTLRHWRHNFYQSLAKIQQLGFDDSFVRMWDYYFCSCIAGFEQRRISNVHMVWIKDE